MLGLTILLSASVRRCSPLINSSYRLGVENRSWIRRGYAGAHGRAGTEAGAELIKRMKAWAAPIPTKINFCEVIILPGKRALNANEPSKPRSVNPTCTDSFEKTPRAQGTAHYARV